VDFDVNQIANELYALAPHAFTAARDEYVGRAKTAGDRVSAAALAKLKRPTVAAWLVNLVALRRPDTVAGLLDLGEELRTATTAGQVRELSARRRREIDAALAEVRSLAPAAGGASPSAQHLAEVEATLTAAMADPEIAGVVRAGRLLRPVSYQGFAAGAAFPGFAGMDVPSDTPAAPATTAPTETDEAGRAAARERVAAAERALDDATSVERSALDDADRITAEIARLRERLDEAEQAARTARQARLTAERELASARRRLARPLRG
jgi:hypothetical protein